MLLSHLDKDAAKRIIVSESDYNAAMKKLEIYFGDKRKVIRDCTQEIAIFPKVAANDFKNLVMLKTCIETNTARLSSLDLLSELSNTTVMKALEVKFPPVQQVEWTKYFNGLEESRQKDIFPEFIKWLDIEVEV